jgi:hypothetical protein
VETKDTLTLLREEAIRAHVGAESMRRAEAYVRRGAVTEARRTGHSLRAMVAGSRPRPYAVEVQVDPFGAITQARCTCPVGRPGRCKHVAVVLMTWLASPEQFIPIVPLESTLTERSREELEAMIRYMAGRRPGLEIAAELAYPGCAALTAQHLSAYRAEVDAIFREFTGLGAASQIAQGLAPLVGLIEGFEARGERTCAVQIAAAVADAVVDQLDRVRDDGFIDEVLIALCGVASRAMTEAALRADALGLVASLCAASLAPGAQREARALALGASAAERAQLAAALRAAGASDSAFLLALEAEGLDDAAYLERCEALGLAREAVARLVARGRIEEAVARIGAVAGALPILELARQLSAQGLGSAVEPLVRTRYRESGEPELLAWLMEQDRASGMYARALAEAQALFWQRPTRAVYDALRELASEQGLWEEIEPLTRAARDQGLLAS